MKTVKEFCDYLGWGVPDLAREAAISYPTAEKALKRQGVLSKAVKRDICSALSRAMDQVINPGDLDW